MPGEAPAGWSRAQRVLHWSIAVLVLVAAPLGIGMVMMPFRDLLAKFLLYQLHKTIGVTIFLLAAATVCLRLRRGRPAWPAAMSRRQRRLAASTHLVLVLLVPATTGAGYLAASAAPIHIPTLYFGVIHLPDVVGPDPVLFALLRRVHLALAIGLVVTAGGHATAAVVHHLRGDDMLRRMSGNVRPAESACCTKGQAMAEHQDTRTSP
jgi:cytochrome b561